MQNDAGVKDMIDGTKNGSKNHCASHHQKLGIDAKNPKGSMKTKKIK